MSKNKNTYWKDLKEAVQSTAKGLSLTWEHFRRAVRQDTNRIKSADEYDFEAPLSGISTNQYPHEMMPIPDNGRYRLHNEIDDCILCNKCAEVCPVNCIEIDAIRGTEQVGTASDGSPIRFYAAKFDIDMAKCCYCGLCTVVCPTECLTMTKTFDYSEFDVTKMNYAFGNLSEEQATRKRQEWESFQAQKKQQNTSKTIAIKPKAEQKQIDNNLSKISLKNKAERQQNTPAPESIKESENNPVSKPTLKIKIPNKEGAVTPKPTIKIKIPSSTQNQQANPPREENPSKKPVIKLKIKKNSPLSDTNPDE